MGETINHSGQSSCTPVRVPEARLSDDFGNLFDRSSFSDVILCVGGREFQAHKAILGGKYTAKNFFLSYFSLVVAMGFEAFECSTG